MGGVTRERELALLPFLVPRNRTALDVGANLGTYTEALVRLCPHVVAIEPNPRWAAELSSMFKEARILRGAASNVVGRAALRVPTSLPLGGMATIEPANVLSGQQVEEIAVDSFTIDSLNLTDVGFIKIDVEGHEDAVLEGAAETIRNSRPNLLVESEERHRPGSVSSTVRRMLGFGYAGYILCNGALMPVSHLDLKANQAELDRDDKEHRRTKRYVNNFVFLPR
jgi:FkbM family methyltransferase